MLDRRVICRKVAIEIRTYMIRIKKFRCNGFEELAYLVWAGKSCAIIDPGFDCDAEFDALHNVLKDNEIAPRAILLTHAHPDHIYGVHRLCEEFGIPVYVNSGEEVTFNALHALCFNVGHPDVEDFSSRIVWVGDGDRIFVPAGRPVSLVHTPGRTGGNDASAENLPESGLEFKVLFTPGHTAGGVCYLCRESGKTSAGRGSNVENGAVNGAENGAANGAANGTENGAANCAENGAVNGTENGAANGTENGAENGAVNGAENGNGSIQESNDADIWSVLFSGDTLFAGCIGRSDLPGGDYTTLMRSIVTRLLPLDGDIDVLPGHGRSTTIGDERTKNPFLQPFNEPYEE